MTRKIRKSGKLVAGFGINDADYTITRSVIIDGRMKILWTCPYYKKWSGMLTRVYNPKELERMPCYKGTSVVAEWVSFMTFKVWLESEVKRVFPNLNKEDESWSEYKLDKDLLVVGNKVYGPSTCMLVSDRCNMILGDNAAVRGKYPLGVDFTKDSGKYRSRVNTPDGSISLGRHLSPEEAHKAWQQAKKEIIISVLESDKDLRVKKSLQIRVDKLQHDIDNGIETVKL